MADQNPDKTTESPGASGMKEYRLAWWLLLGFAGSLAAGVGAWTYLARHSPWLTALSVLVVVLFAIVAFSRAFRPPAQRLWGALLILAASLYFASLSHQAGKPGRESRYLAWMTPRPPKGSADQVVAIAYPRIVPLEAPDKPGWPLSVYLWPPVLRATLTPTATVSSATSAITQTTAGRAMSYTVAFEPYDDGLLFTDQEGAPVPPQVVVRTGQSVDEPAVLYVRRAPVDVVPASVPVKVQVYGADGNPRELTTLHVRLEDAYSAWWRHFWGLVLGPTTPLLALAAALVGFGWQWWQEEQKKKWEVEQEHRRRREKRLAEVERIRLLIRQKDFLEATEKFLEVSHNIEHVWEWEKYDVLITRLADVRAELENLDWDQRVYQEGLQKLREEKLDQATKVANLILRLDPNFDAAAALQLIVQLLQDHRIDPGHAQRQVEELGDEHASAALKRVEKDGGRRVASVLKELKTDLLNRPQFHKAYFGPDRFRWQDLEILKQIRFVWPLLWSAERPPDPPAIANWLGESDTELDFNPFGPERAEMDPLLPRLFVEPPGWEQLRAAVPMIVCGAKGSGRTASRLMLTHTCTTTRLGPERTAAQADTFPVHLDLFPEGKSEEADLTCWRMLTRALAQATLDFLALNPQSFAETPFRQRRALARLFALHRHNLGDLASYLAGEGLDRAVAIHLADTIREAGRGTQPPRLTDEPGLLAMLAEARLSPFQQCYLLIEIPKEVSVHVPTAEIASGLKPLLQVMPSLAARRVYLKLFVSTEMATLLKPSPSRVETVELAWERPALREMLQWRVQQAGVPSFRAVFRRLPKGIDPSALLVQAALETEGPPRRLIQVGQDLLLEHVHRAPGDPRFTREELKAVLEKSEPESMP
jgi:hypothetical protein